MTSWYDRNIMPRLIACACAAPAIAKQRQKVVPGAEGRVLELGVGGGMNMACYDPTKVSAVVGIDPSAELRARAMAAPRPAGLVVEVINGAAEALPFDAASFDTVVCTYTLCTVRSPAQALAEARRVLRPGGRLLFCEHGLSPDDGVAVWQRRLEPIWKALAGGCHMTRPVGQTIAAHGFELERLETMYLPNAPKISGWNEWGVARPA